MKKRKEKKFEALWAATDQMVELWRRKIEHATEELSNLATVRVCLRNAGRGKIWKDVAKIKLKNGQCYIIRRTFGDKKLEPVPAQWRDEWRVLIGSIRSETKSGAGIEVWA